MKKGETISTLLGVSQIEMALLLKITRSQWSMYESGKRDLPQDVKQQLAEIITYMQATKTKVSENLPQLSIQKNQTKENLQALLKENQYQQLLSNKKVAGLEKNREL